MLRSLVKISCTGADLGYGRRHPTRQRRTVPETLLNLVGVPRKQEIPVPFEDGLRDLRTEGRDK